MQNNGFIGAKGVPYQQNNRQQMRTLTLKRGNSFFGCAVTLSVVIDGLECAAIKAGQMVSIPITREAHEIFVRQGGAFRGQSERFPIPAGTGDLSGEIKPIPFKDNAWDIVLRAQGMDIGTFSREAEREVLAQFRQSSMQQLLNHPNNRRRDLRFYLDATGMTVCFEAAQTKGFGQWASGRESFHFPYLQMGLSAPESVPPGFYEQLTQRCVQALLAEGVWRINQFGALYC